MLCGKRRFKKIILHFIIKIYCLKILIKVYFKILTMNFSYYYFFFFQWDMERFAITSVFGAFFFFFFFYIFILNLSVIFLLTLVKLL